MLLLKIFMVLMWKKCVYLCIIFCSFIIFMCIIKCLALRSRDARASGRIRSRILLIILSEMVIIMCVLIYCLRWVSEMCCMCFIMM